MGPEIRTSESIAQLAAALAKAQARIEAAPRDAAGQVGTRLYQYATLTSVFAAIREPFAENGLAVVQVPGSQAVDGERVMRVPLTTRIMHESGEWIEGTMVADTEYLGPQAVGSVITYLRRYALQAMAGVPAADDDGAAGQGEADTAAQPNRSSAARAGLPTAVPFGKNRGVPLADLEDSSLEWYMNRARAKLAEMAEDGTPERILEQERRWSAALDAEKLRRLGEPVKDELDQLADAMDA